MHLEYGISIIYITHDLATAYQISDNIVVLYRGAVIEAGNVTWWSSSPAIPTRSCSFRPFPWPAPHAPGLLRMARVPGSNPLGVLDAVCRSLPPRDVSMLRRRRRSFTRERYRAVSCYLYQSAPILAADELGKALAEPARLSHN